MAAMPMAMWSMYRLVRTMPMRTMPTLVLTMTMWSMSALVRGMTMWSMSVATMALAVHMTMAVVVTMVMLRTVSLRGWSCGAGSFVYQLGKSLLVEGGVDKTLNCMSKGARLKYGVLNGIGVVVNAVTNGTKVPDIK